MVVLFKMISSYILKSINKMLNIFRHQHWHITAVTPKRIYIQLCAKWPNLFYLWKAPNTLPLKTNIRRANSWRSADYPISLEVICKSLQIKMMVYRGGRFLTFRQRFFYVISLMAVKKADLYWELYCSSPSSVLGIS